MVGAGTDTERLAYTDGARWSGKKLYDGNCVRMATTREGGLGNRPV